MPSPSSAHDFARAAASTGERQVPNSAVEPFGETTIDGSKAMGFTISLEKSMNQHPLISINQHKVSSESSVPGF